MTGSPRPAHLDLYGRSANVVETGHGERAGRSPIRRCSWRCRRYRPAPSDDEIERAAAKLRAAKRIVIVAGTGAAASGAGPEVLALGEALAAPIGTSLGGRGVIPTRHRLSIGCPGNYAAPPANQIVHEADLVLFVGCHTGDQVTHTWRIPPLDTEVRADRHRPAGTRPQLSEHARPDGRSEGDAGEAADAAIGKPARDTAFADRAAGIVAAWREARAPLLASNAAPILPDRLCAEITRALPEDGILVADTGYSGIWTSTLIELNGDGADLSARGGLARLGVPRLARREMRGAASAR